MQGLKFWSKILAYTTGLLQEETMAYHYFTWYSEFIRAWQDQNNDLVGPTNDRVCNSTGP